jgi:hypothetical protein
MRLVGEGDDQIRDWNAPISDYYNVVSICDLCSEFGYDFPLVKLQIELEKHNVLLNLKSAKAFDDTTVFLEALLSPYFHTSNSAWGGESPGRSGVFKRAYLELGQTKQLRRVLRIADDFISNWAESSGLNAVVDANRIESEIAQRVAAEKKSAATSDFHRDQILQKEAWEDKLFSQVQAAVNQRSSNAFCRFNFLVHNGIVFFLDRDWWHSTNGSVSAVAERLERTPDLTLVRCEVRKTRFGWIPHFGRTREEELAIGWRETGIEVIPPSRWSDQLYDAMQAEK